MLELGGRSRSPGGTGPAPSAAASSGRSTFTATWRSVLQVLGEIDRGHAARAELALDAVAVGEGGAKPRGDFDRWSAQCASIGWYLSSQASAS